MIVRRYIVSLADGVVLSMDETGQTREWETPLAVVRHIKRRDNIAARAGRSTVSVIEWQNVPEGFVPPEVP